MSCAHKIRMVEPVQKSGDIALGEPAQTTFGRIVVCVGCKTPMGDVLLLTAGQPKSWNGTSWALMLRVHPRPPYVFKMDKAGKLLVPLTYDEEAK